MKRCTTLPIFLLTPADHQTVGYSPVPDEKATVKVLIEGYARKIENGWVASSTACLVISSGFKIITDPGCNRKKLIEALSRENLSAEDIDYVFLSHGHPDHMMLAGIFANAKYVTYDDQLVDDQDLMIKFDKHILGPHTEIISTPGHVDDHISLLVHTCKGIVAIAGDVFWWPVGEKQYPDNPVYSDSTDHQKLAGSQALLMRMADFIIPGHGKMFRVNK